VGVLVLGSAEGVVVRGARGREGLAHDLNELAAVSAEFAGFIGAVRGIEFVPIEFEVGPGTVATWDRAITDRVDGFKWEWEGRSSKHIPFDGSGP